MEYFWNPEKNETLKKERGISFEEIVQAIKDGNILDAQDHPTRKHQKIYVIEVKEYVYAVPYVQMGRDEIFLKTIFPDRKLAKRFQKGKYAQ
ncbi:MAG: BrnT family toxin [SAR324 cluster bacterium]|nr:BrnT family toxin [SAR324 cluster bacterium]